VGFILNSKRDLEREREGDPKERRIGVKSPEKERKTLVGGEVRPPEQTSGTIEDQGRGEKKERRKGYTGYFRIPTIDEKRKKAKYSLERWD